MSNRVLFYDIETTPLKAWVWSTGEQRVTPAQLVEGFSMYDIITFSWAWGDENIVHSMDWGHEKNSLNMVKMFDELAESADVIIGKNNARFDDKVMAVLRMRHGLPGRPEFEYKTDDLEKHIRKRFRLPSYTLDYVSKMLGREGKQPMCLDDWIGIMERNDPELIEKMKEYNKKDVEDTKFIWNYLVGHFIPKVKEKSEVKGEMVCITCGSKDVRKNGTRHYAATTYQEYRCKTHNGYAGRMPISQLKK